MKMAQIIARAKRGTALARVRYAEEIRAQTPGTAPPCVARFPLTQGTKMAPARKACLWVHGPPNLAVSCQGHPTANYGLGRPPARGGAEDLEKANQDWSRQKRRLYSRQPAGCYAKRRPAKLRASLASESAALRSQSELPPGMADGQPGETGPVPARSALQFITFFSRGKLIAHPGPGLHHAVLVGGDGGAAVAVVVFGETLNPPQIKRFFASLSHLFLSFTALRLLFGFLAFLTFFC